MTDLPADLVTLVAQAICDADTGMLCSYETLAIAALEASGHASFVAEVASLRAENERLGKAVCSGVLGELLAPDENEALLAFVKQLRRDSAGTATAADCGDNPVPKDCQARAGTASPNPSSHVQKG